MAKFIVYGESGGEAVEAELGSLAVTLGRAESGEGSMVSDFVGLPDPAVSAAHAQLQLRGGRWYVIDLASTNGTRLDEEPVMPNQLVPFPPGTTLQLGRSTTLEIKSVPTEGERVAVPVDSTAPLFSLEGVAEHLSAAERAQLAEMGADLGVSGTEAWLSVEERELLAGSGLAIPEHPALTQDSTAALSEALASSEPEGPDAETVATPRAVYPAPRAEPVGEPVLPQQPLEQAPGPSGMVIAIGVLSLAVVLLIVLLVSRWVA